MKLHSFLFQDQRRIGAEIDGQLLDLSAGYAAWIAAHGPRQGGLRTIPADMLSFIRLGKLAMEAARETILYFRKRPAVPVGAEIVYSFEAVKLLAPIPRPGKILCSGINYRGQQEESSEEMPPSDPFFFSKVPSTVIGPGEAIIKPKLTEQLDFEVELAVVIGKRLKAVPEEQVMNGIFGYTILHDVSARDIQFREKQLTLAKNFDTFCPLGPCIVTADELPDAGALKLRSMLNGQVMQEATTADWLFPLPRLISFLSTIMTLEPGDVVSTGTPPGVGVFRKPPVFMNPGDVAVLEIEGIGRLENSIVAGS